MRTLRALRGGGRQAWLDRWNAVVLLACCAFTIGPSLLGLRTLISVDLLTRFLPWRANGLDVEGHQVCTSDTIDSVMPMMATIRRELFAGHLPVWQNYGGGGSDLAGVPDPGALSPLALPYYVVPLWLAPAFVMLLQIATCVGGMYLLLRRLGTSRAAGLLAGFVYANSGFLVVWTNWPQTRTAAVLPWLLWAVERLVQRRKPGDVAIIALVVAALLFGGFPQVTGFGLYLATGYLLVRVVAVYRHELRAAATVVGLAFGGLVLGAGVTAVQLFPFLAFLRTGDFAYRGTGPQLPSATLVTTAVPNAYGSCLAGRPVSSPINPVEMIAFVGAAALVLAVVGVAHSRGADEPDRGVRSYFAVAIVAVLAIGWLSPLALELVRHFPVFADNAVSRIRVLLGLVAAALAGLGYDRLCRWAVGRCDDEPATRPWWRRPAVVVTVTIWTLASLTVLGFGYHLFRVQQTSHTSRLHDAIMPALLAAGALVAIVLARWAPSRAAVAAVAVVPVLVMAQSASFFHTFLPGDTVEDFYPVTGTHRFLSDHLGHDRYAGVNTMFAQTAPYYGQRTPTGHIFFEPSWQQMLVAIDPKVMQSPTNAAFTTLTPQTAARSPLLDRMAVRYVAFPAADLTGAVAAPATDSSSCRLTGPLRGVRVTTGGLLTPASTDAGMTVTATLRGPGGTRTAAHWYDSAQAAGSVLSLPVAAEDLPAGQPLQVSFSVAGASTPLVLTGGCSAVAPAADGLRLVYADRATVVYQRLSSLERVRWASAAVSAPSNEAATDLLRTGRVGADTVVLTGGGPAASGAPAQLDTTADGGTSVTVHVRAAGAGYLVLADALQVDGARVSVDGHAATLRDADGAMVAVYVPAGEHTVTFGYRPPGMVAGAVVSSVSALLVIGLFWWDRRRRLRGSGPASA